MTTFGRQLAAHRGIGPGFDAVRLGLASAVIYVHRGLIVPGGIDPAAPLVPHLPVASWVFDTLPVPLFFALSGFLVAASAERLPIGQFLLNRALRVLPALWLATAISALILGPLLTTATLHDYVSNPLFRHYFLNLAALIRYDLPGVFLGNPESAIVNGSLWTVPQEISCYVLLAGVTACGLLRRRALLLGATLALCVFSIAISLCHRLGIMLPQGETLAYVFVTRGAARLVPFFLTGVLAYLYRDAIPYGGVRAAGAAALAYVGLCGFGEPSWVGDPLFTLVSAPLLTYAVIAAGLSPALRLRAPGGGDYSYGIYLYGFPLQQAIVAIVPGMTNLPAFMIASMTSTGLMAIVSWHAVEKPVLRLRRRFSVAARIHTRPEVIAGFGAAEAGPRPAPYPSTVTSRARGRAHATDRTVLATGAASLDPSMNQSSAAVLIE